MARKTTIIAMCVLCLCLATTFAALLNIRRVALPPALYFERFWGKTFSIDELAEIGIPKGDLNISVVDSCFENAFISYTKILVWADDPTVKEASVSNVTFDEIPTLLFKVNTEIAKNDVYVVFEFVLAQPVNVTITSHLVVIGEAMGRADTARIELAGNDADGNWIHAGVLDFLPNRSFSAFVLPLHERGYRYQTIEKVLVVFHCTPGNSISMTTKIRVLNVVGGGPSVDNVQITWGRDYIYLKGIEFPHMLQWDSLVPYRIYLISTLQESIAKWSSFLNVMNYTWTFPNADYTSERAIRLVIWLDRSNDAPMISAKIRAVERGALEEVDVMKYIQLASSTTTSRYFMSEVAMPLRYEEASISIVFDFWPAPWKEVALLSCAIIAIESFIVTYYRRYMSKTPSR